MSVNIVIAWVTSTPGDQPAIMPPAPSNMNAEPPDLPAAETTKSVVLEFATMPVGSNGTPPVLAARLTISGVAAGCGTPLPS